MFVQFTDETETTICTVFGAPQDPKNYPNYGEVDENDDRLVEFYTRPVPPFDPETDQ